MADSNSQSFYAVIIICLVVFFSLSACLGIRIIKRIRDRNEDKQTLPLRTNHEWQSPHSVTQLTPLESIDPQSLKAIENWQSKYPPNTNQYIDVSQQPEVINKGVLAWRFMESITTAESEEESNAAVMDEDTSCIVFCQGQGSIMTNLPVPAQEFCYWEVKVLQLTDQDRLAIGFATKPYPRWTIPGFHAHSIAYHSNTGAIFASDPVYGRPYGPAFKEGDVVGVGYLCQSGTVFFTRNGKNLGKASIGFKYPIYPIIGSIGPCQVSVNFGFEDFLFTPANLREAAFAPRQGTLLPPPAYGGHLQDVLFNEGSTDSFYQSPMNSETHLTYNNTHIQPPPPSYS